MFISWVVLILQVILMTLLVICQIPQKTATILSVYVSEGKTYVPNHPTDEDIIPDFSIWSKRRKYSMPLINHTYYNLDRVDNFQNHLLASEIFLLASSVISIFNFVLSTDKLTRKMMARKPVDYDPNKFKWLHIACAFSQFYGVLVTAWLYSTLVHITAHNSSLVCMYVNALVAASITVCVINPRLSFPRWNKKKLKIRGYARVLLITGILSSVMSFFLAFGCIPMLEEYLPG